MTVKQVSFQISPSVETTILKHLEKNNAGHLSIKLFRRRHKLHKKYKIYDDNPIGPLETYAIEKRSGFRGRYRPLRQLITLRFGEESFPSIEQKDQHGNQIPAFLNRDEEVLWLFYHEFCHHLQFEAMADKRQLSKSRFSEKEANIYADQHLALYRNGELKKED